MASLCLGFICLDLSRSGIAALSAARIVLEVERRAAADITAARLVAPSALHESSVGEAIRSQSNRGSEIILPSADDKKKKR